MASSENSQKKSWFEGLKAEFGKIIWPSQQDLVKETTAVMVVSIILGVIITVLDYVIQNGINLLTSITF